MKLVGLSDITRPEVNSESAVQFFFLEQYY